MEKVYVSDKETWLHT